MNLSGIKAQDIVFCDVRGDRFWAIVEEHRRSGDRTPALRIASLTGRPVPAYHVGARQVLGHWRKSKASKL